MFKASASFTIGATRFTIHAETKPAQLQATGRTIDLKPIEPGSLELSISGESSDGSMGQIGEALSAAHREAGAYDGNVLRLCEFWKRWHLNGMRPGTREQMDVLRNVPAAWGYDKRKEALALADRDVDRVTKPSAPYSYGSAWLYEPLPAHILPELEIIMRELDGARLGNAGDVDDAPEASGERIDSRDVIKRLEIFRSALIERGADESTLDTATDADFDPDDLPGDDAGGWCNADLWAEFLALRELNDAAPGDDWEHGASMIRADTFTAYAEELAEDIGAVQRDAAWPNNHIDWEGAAHALQQDYTEVSFRGDSYFVR